MLQRLSYFSHKVIQRSYRNFTTTIVIRSPMEIVLFLLQYMPKIRRNGEF
jgi:predicted acyltransferase (DUF342 family)